ncbi:MAG: bifunctional (p)ppGpp synthetase/guanosine-3',5'-bis(diphosphate) 3'-pyrophosphohydrolase [Paraclostridium bifermentans]|jgi:guanosine-3',5'-bis(diphosphate) 3'-pyrophosphohydrolase|uniref:RelA/SpoT family protein n=1 Tax=Paraclostridium bifermentans TaxID=1490 RepID=UPI000DF7C5C5|nr:bifunctional (p)ppGpp synthetase/guanosine-3',5'-bis(diphosphate) 3'-pyrophosphohydrolase [Paraclostridium bifermentans]RDC49969.1 bifunctional (p)ppGpp synthetase/guanosine-3',5'-bis(diphosphate) 3'-pyrophosphohydrolase [Acinetobacter sp. RIT592]MBS5954350.1 bifunctional (p)ppGpp synthetase/guanosine-3',5'-bis(diphosphate) 3'-pyrophosphohydrolase [Paraclostridium bifermentans]MBU5289183.1 bifunctional (p)ppGpp synthetase/guanosine-3',5'-bis(diphosphate) 3'-pyrophosphohydrolase [Paraclostridi
MQDKQLQELIEKIKRYAPNGDLDLIEKAYYYGKKAHEGQLRKSGEPYFIHPIAVANILCDMELDMQTIAAGLLHDVVEDTEFTYEDIKNDFGEEIADLVDGVTKLGQIKYKSKEETQAENLRKMFLAMSKDIRVILIKLADRLHNMRTLKFMPPEKAKAKATETLEIYGGIASRLGIYKVKWELEDIALRYIDSDGYYDLVEKVAKKRSQREAYIERIVHVLKEKFDEVNINCDIYGRPKHFYSIYRKMKNKHKDFEEIYDLMAVRIIVNSVKDCYAVLGMVHTLWKPIPGRFKDYIAMPKPNMYQSLHTIVVGPDGEPLEIQIRTKEMHNIAEYGIAAHWKYKEGKTSVKESKLEEKLQWLRQMMEWEKDLKDPQEFMDALKDDVFNSQVYVFTPKGDVIELPAGSTPIDFAYRVHTNVGNKCVGAKINGRIVTLDYKLQNGNIVEILTSANSSGPSRDWINIVQTPNAKSKIRQWFKKERREENIERGNLILEKEFKKYSIPTKDPIIEKYMLQMARKFNQPTVGDLVATIGYGGIMPSQIVPKVKELYEKDHVKKSSEIKVIDDINKHSIGEQEYTKKRKKSSPQGIIVKGVDNILVRFAKCCNPIPGDEIIGYITKGRGVAVHRKDCPNSNLDNEYFRNRLVEVSWENSNNAKFEAEIQIQAEDRRGIINDITHIVSIEKVSLNGINARKGKLNIVSVNLLVEVDSIETLTLLMKKVRAIPGVEDIYRVIN